MIDVLCRIQDHFTYTTAASIMEGGFVRLKHTTMRRLLSVLPMFCLGGSQHEQTACSLRWASEVAITMHSQYGNITTRLLMVGII